MLRAFSTLLALALIGFAALIIVPAPTVFFWKLSIIATEYGHWLAAASLALALLTILGLGFFGLRFMQALLLLSATAVLAWPTLQAWKLSQTLPLDFTAATAYTPQTPPFDLEKLWTLSTEETAKVRTETVLSSDKQKLPLSLYLPPLRTNTAHPCVIVVHGGGWDSGDRHQLSHYNHTLAAEGYAVLAISYRLAPKHRWPAQAEDLLAALAWLRTNADRYKLDPERIALLGRSAGAHIAITTAYTHSIEGLRAVIGLYGPYDLRFAYEHGFEDDLLRSPALIRNLVGGPPETHGAGFDEASAIGFVRENLPATLLIHGERDPLVWHKQSERLTTRLKEAHAPHFFLSLPWATHGFDYNPHGPSGQLSDWAIRAFLKVKLQSPD